MEHSKDFYQNLVKVLEYLLNVDRSINNDKGREIAGDYWGAILDFFRNNRGTYLMCGGHVGTNDRAVLKSILAESKHMIEEIEKSEYDRELANTESQENIKYGRKGYRISIVAIWLSAIAILVEIIRGILDLLL